MRISHIAIWTSDIVTLKDFYCSRFGGTVGLLYENPAKGFRSYFIRFDDEVRLEIMERTDITKPITEEMLGYAHFAISVGSEASVRIKTEELEKSGVQILSAPRWTGDGYFESVILDPDGNRVEITI